MDGKPMLFYFDLENTELVQEFCRQIRKIGVGHATFFSRDVSHFITDHPLFPNTGRRQWSSTVRPMFSSGLLLESSERVFPDRNGASSLQLLPKAGSTPQIPVQTPGEDSSPTELLDQSRMQRKSDLLAKAKLLNISVWTPAQLYQYLKQSLAEPDRDGIFARKRTGSLDIDLLINLADRRPKRSVCGTRLYKTFEFPYSMIEDLRGQHRPVFKEYIQAIGKAVPIPILNFYALPGTCPFVRSRRRLDQGVRSKTKMRRPGFCECCIERYSDLDDHVQQPKHRKYAQCSENYLAVDQLIQTLQRPFKLTVEDGTDKWDVDPFPQYLICPSLEPSPASIYPKGLDYAHECPNHFKENNVQINTFY